MAGRAPVRGLRRLRQPRAATAMLLVLAAVAAVATLVPQNDVAPRTVAAWRSGAAGPGRNVAQALDALGLFSITGSWWWSALIVLVAVAGSWWVAASARTVVREWSSPVGAGRRAAQRSVHLPASPAPLASAITELLRGHGFGVSTTDDDGGGGGSVTLVATRGRAGGIATLATHAALPLLLLGIMVAQAFAFTGQVDLVEGEAVTDTAVAYDDVTHGPLWTAADHRGFVLTLDDFAVAFHPDGTPDDFVSDVRVDDGAPRQVRINDPLRADGMMISLLRYGVAPRLVVTDRATDDVHFDAPVRLAEAERTWAGTTPLSARGRYVLDAALVAADQDAVERQGAVPDNPVLLLDIFDADRDGTRGALRDQVAVPVGGTVAALDDTVDVRVDDMAMWAGFQVSHPAGRWLLLTGAIALLIGLTGALWITRERISVRLRPYDDGTEATLMATASRGPDSACARLDALLPALRRDLGDDA